MIKRVHIKGYKSLVDTQVELRPLSVLFGPNASGKSNFLDALQLLSRMTSSRTLLDAFEAPHRGKAIESISSRGDFFAVDNRLFSFEVDFDLSDSTIKGVEKTCAQYRRRDSASQRSDAVDDTFIRHRILRYCIAVEVNPQLGILRVTDESLTPLTSKHVPSKSRNPFLERIGERIHLRMEGQAHPKQLEVGLDHSILSTPLYPPHYPHALAAQRELSSWLFFYLEPRERMRQPNPVKETLHLGPMGEDLAAFLNTLKAQRPQQFRAIVQALHLLIPSVDHVDVEVSRVGEVEIFFQEGRDRISARLASEGTLRMLALLALFSSAEPPTLVGLEEPENGVHPRRVRLIAELLTSQQDGGDIQVIATTHSPLLLDRLKSDVLFVTRKVEKGTKIVPFLELPLWRTMDIESGLEDNGEPMPVSQRMLRGDFDV